MCVPKPRDWTPVTKALLIAYRESEKSERARARERAREKERESVCERKRPEETEKHKNAVFIVST